MNVKAREKDLIFCHLKAKEDLLASNEFETVLPLIPWTSFMFTGRHKFHKSRFADARDNFSKESHRGFIVLRPRLAMNLLNKNCLESLDSFSPLLLQTVDVNGEILLTEILLHGTWECCGDKHDLFLWPWNSYLFWHDAFLKIYFLIIWSKLSISFQKKSTFYFLIAVTKMKISSKKIVKITLFLRFVVQKLIFEAPCKFFILLI